MARHRHCAGLANEYCTRLPHEAHSDEWFAHAISGSRHARARDLSLLHRTVHARHFLPLSRVSHCLFYFFSPSAWSLALYYCCCCSRARSIWSDDSLVSTGVESLPYHSYLYVHMKYIRSDHLFLRREVKVGGRRDKLAGSPYATQRSGRV
jgi:hypothetical protein